MKLPSRTTPRAQPGESGLSKAAKTWSTVWMTRGASCWAKQGTAARIERVTRNNVAARRNGVMDQAPLAGLQSAVESITGEALVDDGAGVLSGSAPCLLFVSVASKGLRILLSLLESTVRDDSFKCLFQRT